VNTQCYASSPSSGREGGLDPHRIKADNHGSIDDGDWGCHISEPLKFFDSSGVLGHVSFVERNLPLRKILFRPLAEHSAGLREYCDGLLHRQ
jgi:hypothetical protein